MNIIEILKEKNLTISTAESLTAGLVASNICSISGASNYFKGGIVSYTKQIKHELLGLSLEDIEKYGVYSNETVISMAKSIANKCKSDLAISTSGVAGPGSDEGVKEGSVYFGFYIKGEVITDFHIFSGNRNEIRNKAAEYSISKMIELLSKKC